MAYPDVEREASFSGPVSEFVQAVNSRRRRLQVGDEWIRFSPFNKGELRDLSNYPDNVKFWTPGSVVKVTSVEEKYVDIRCAGDTLIVAIPYFMSSFVRLVRGSEWRRYGPAARKS